VPARRGSCRAGAAAGAPRSPWGSCGRRKVRRASEEVADPQVQVIPHSSLAVPPASYYFAARGSPTGLAGDFGS
jgi:hypothetical protein